MAAIGSPTLPVYIDENGAAKECEREIPTSGGSIGWPNYSSGRSVSSGTTMTETGWLRCSRGANDGLGRVYINGIEVWNSTLYDAHYGMGIVPISTGDKATSSNASMYFFPCKT